VTAGSFRTSGTSDYRPAARALRVLVVDDERDSVTTLLVILRSEGYEVEGVYDGFAAIRQLDEFDPDAIVLDIAMPGMTGWDVAREVRKRHRSRPTLIAITGTFLAPPDEVVARVAGFNHFLLKPSQPDKLIGILNALKPSTR
jgi:two-component system, OmpR family, response regulator